MTLFACRFGGVILGALTAIAATAALPVRTPLGGALAGVLGACGGLLVSAAVGAAVHGREVAALTAAAAEGVNAVGLAALVAMWKADHPDYRQEWRRANARWHAVWVRD